MARRSKKRRRLARGSIAPPLREQVVATGPVPVMDSPLTMPAEAVGIEEARAAVRALWSRARARS
jgi:hypothetical protein